MSVHDPLGGVAVKIVISIKPDADMRDERTVLVSVGVADEMPVLVKGSFGELGELIGRAWVNQGRAQSSTPVAPPSDSDDEGVVLATADAAYGDDDIW